MATQAEVIRQNLQQNQARETAQQMNNFGGQPEVQELANAAFPSGSTDAALAAHLKEMRDKSAEYALLRSAEAREQWESIAANNFLRDQRNKELIKEQVAAAKANQEYRDNAEGERLALQMQALTDTFEPNWTPETLPQDKLVALSNLRQRIQMLAAATGAPGLADGVLESGGPLSPANILGQLPNGPQAQPQAQPQARPETFPDGSLYQFQNLPDGNVEVRLITGEVFKGDPITVTRTIAESNVRTKLWARGKRPGEELPVAPHPSAEPIQLNQPPAQTKPASGSLADDLASRQADALARQFGFSGKDEMMQWGETVNQKIAKVEQFEEQELAARFHANNPDFPDTEETAETVMQIIQSNGWQPNLESLTAAHALAIRNGLYQPLTAEQIQIANGVAPQQQSRTAPPPMLRTNNPEITSGVGDLSYKTLINMPSSELRKMAIAQELEGKGPHYR